MSQQTQQRQKPLESLAICGFDGEEVDEENVKTALRAPCFSRLKHIACSSPTLSVVADYLGKEGGRPSLSLLEIGLIFADGADVALLMKALAAEGAGAPNLCSLHLERADDSTLAALGAVYAAGGLTQLRLLSFKSPRLTDTGIRSLCDALGTTLLKGGALEEIEIEEQADDEERAMVEERIRMFREELEAAQARDIFANVQLTFEIDDMRDFVALLANYGMGADDD